MTIGANPSLNSPNNAIGLHRLVEEMDLRAPLPAVRSEAIAGARKTHVNPDTTVIEQYPASYAPKDIWGNLRFAMRYEPIDLGVLSAFFHVIDHRKLETWVRSESTGIFARRAWYLFEMLTGRMLDLPDVLPTGYASLLRPEAHITAKGIRVQRQKLVNNLLGDREYCPLIRRTGDLDGWMRQDFRQMFQEVVSGASPAVLERAVQYLFVKETKSSFAIEGESPDLGKERRFVQVLQKVGNFNTSSMDAFVQLQKLILDARYVESDWRIKQNYVGTSLLDSEIVHLISPKPEDLHSLMDGWMRSIARIGKGGVNPICVAAIAGFGFVYLHPFQDGNGRIHRFLIHHSLAKLGFTPPGVLFPVSASMLRNKAAYDQALEVFSSRIRPLIDYIMDDQRQMSVLGDTVSLYRYPDLTAQTEYLYLRVADTIDTDMRQEVGFIESYDRALKALKDVVDMPDPRASLLARLIMQNHGRLSKGKRGQFPELTDEEIAAIEAAIGRDQAGKEAL